MRRNFLFAAVSLIALTIACQKREAPASAASAQAAQSPSGTAPAAESREAVAAIPEVGKPMPPYRGEWLDGREFDLASERGNVVLLNIWATWCGPCRYEIPELEKLHQKNASRGFKVIGVSLDETGADAVKKFVAEHKMTYPVALDAEGRIANIFQTSIIPTSAIIDRDGKVVWKGFGAIDPNDSVMSSALDTALIAKRASS